LGDVQLGHLPTLVIPMAILVPGRAARDGFWFELKVHAAMWRGTGMGRGLMVTG